MNKFNKMIKKEIQIFEEILNQVFNHINIIEKDELIETIEGLY